MNDFLEVTAHTKCWQHQPFLIVSDLERPFRVQQGALINDVLEHILEKIERGMVYNLDNVNDNVKYGNKIYMLI